MLMHTLYAEYFALCCTHKKKHVCDMSVLEKNAMNKEFF